MHAKRTDQNTTNILQLLNQSVQQNDRNTLQCSYGMPDAQISHQHDQPTEMKTTTQHESIHGSMTHQQPLNIHTIAYENPSPAHTHFKKYLKQHTISLTSNFPMNLQMLCDRYPFDDERFERVFRSIQHGDKIHITGGSHEGVSGSVGFFHRSNSTKPPHPAILRALFIFYCYT